MLIPRTVCLNGNDTTRFMHEMTFGELNRISLEKGSFNRVLPEHRTTLIKQRNGFPVEGRFDFLFEVSGREKIGFEVLTRPTPGKMLEKLAYAENVDRFVFVLPSEALGIYRKTGSSPFPLAVRPRFFVRQFSAPNLHAWLLDMQKGSFALKGKFSSVFNVLG